jgi:hypothetical protein
VISHNRLGYFSALIFFVCEKTGVKKIKIVQAQRRFFINRSPGNVGLKVRQTG